jgi:hypothetical protein
MMIRSVLGIKSNASNLSKSYLLLAFGHLIILVIMMRLERDNNGSSLILLS